MLRPLREMTQYSFRGSSIAVRILYHAATFPIHAAHDSLNGLFQMSSRIPRKRDRARLDRLEALGPFAHDYDRFSQGRCLFLNSPRVCENERSAVHEKHERLIGERFD